MWPLQSPSNSLCTTCFSARYHQETTIMCLLSRTFCPRAVCSHFHWCLNITNLPGFLPVSHQLPLNASGISTSDLSQALALRRKNLRSKFQVSNESTHSRVKHFFSPAPKSKLSLEEPEKNCSVIYGKKAIQPLTLHVLMGNAHGPYAKAILHCLSRETAAYSRRKVERGICCLCIF